MRLRYIRLKGTPPIRDLAYRFGHERMLGQECAFHFIVGVNGTGKTRMLQAVMETFTHLERQKMPPFPITLVYDRGRGRHAETVVFCKPADRKLEPCLASFALLDDREPAEWDRLADDLTRVTGKPQIEGLKQLYTKSDLPGSTVIKQWLPSTILAYTSGDSSPWHAAEYSAAMKDEDDYSSLGTTEDFEEAPAGSMCLEYDIMTRREESSSSSSAEETGEDTIGLFIPPDEIPLATFAAALFHAAKEWEQYPAEDDEKQLIKEIRDSLAKKKRMHGLRGILNEVGWLWPVTATLEIEVPTERYPSWVRSRLKELLDLAAACRRTPGVGGSCSLHFDLREVRTHGGTEARCVKHLAEALGISSVTPLGVFTLLRRWKRMGVLTGLKYTVKKLCPDDLLSYDWLSDGEREFVGRMALFHLFNGSDSSQVGDDALILFDEPETHFNDFWKRDLVDIIDDRLRCSTANVIISTHSSIALTDVFDTEIAKLTKNPDTGEVSAAPPAIRTFGASPTDIMQDVFDAPASVGQRASEYLDMILVMSEHPDETEGIWKRYAVAMSKAFAFDDNVLIHQVTGDPAFGVIDSALQSLAYDYGTDEERKERLARALIAIAKQEGVTDPDHGPRVYDVMEAMEKRIGPGYYMLEFRRRRRALESRHEGGQHAPQD